MTPFTIGQEVTFPHMRHTTGGVIVDRTTDADGVVWCKVRNAHGVDVDWREDALYAKTAVRDAARAAAEQAAVDEAAVYAARQALIVKPKETPQ